ncbi:hypothetical protein LVJ94_50540 [Pendulispora rubella]|uniref:Uncharacterized protein n=1 Tax=Pendulispora rubella TaxID=2741070 RepID=A0ABZ2L2H3_9BACT
MSTPPDVDSAAAAALPRDELVAMVSRAHEGSAYAESTQAGRALAAQSKLPKIIAENLGAGFGQWSFFPDAGEIVDFACAYTPPSTEDEIWAIARGWASDDAASRHTILALVGREILQHELRRIPVPKLLELVDEARPARALALRASLGLEVPPAAAAKPARKEKKPAAGKAAPKREIPTRMPRPTATPRAKAAPEAPPKRFAHPKFGEGVLERQDGTGPEAKLTIKFDSGSKTLLARYVTELST